MKGRSRAYTLTDSNNTLGKSRISIVLKTAGDMIVHYSRTPRTIDRRRSSPASWSFSEQRDVLYWGRGSPRHISVDCRIVRLGPLNGPHVSASGAVRRFANMRANSPTWRGHRKPADALSVAAQERRTTRGKSAPYRIRWKHPNFSVRSCGGGVALAARRAADVMPVIGSSTAGRQMNRQGLKDARCIFHIDGQGGNVGARLDVPATVLARADRGDRVTTARNSSNGRTGTAALDTVRR